MGKEIERKFLMDSSRFGPLSPHVEKQAQCLEQFYLADDPWVRVRLLSRLDQPRPFCAFLTIKGRGTLVRDEFEYPLPVEDAIAMRSMGKGVIEKVRYHVAYGNHLWDVDCFKKPFDNLWLAEVELKSADEAFECPPWITEEVTEDFRYSNAWLVKHGAPPPSTLEDLQDLINWRADTSDYDGDELVDLVCADLGRDEVHFLPEALQPAHKAFRAMSEESRGALVAQILNDT